MFVTTGILSSGFLRGMESYSAIVTQSPLMFGIIGSGVGLLLYPNESAVIGGLIGCAVVGGLIGYFFAKALQSVVWTTLGDTRQ